MPHILQSYEEATNFYSHVQSARSERTAIRWRDAIEEARQQLNLERAEDPDPPNPRRLHDFLPKLDVA